MYVKSILGNPTNAASILFRMHVCGLDSSDRGQVPNVWRPVSLGSASCTCKMEQIPELVDWYDVLQAFAHKCPRRNSIADTT